MVRLSSEPSWRRLGGRRSTTIGALYVHHGILNRRSAFVLCYDPQRDPEDADMKSPAWTASVERATQLLRAGKLAAATRAFETALALAERDGDAEAVARSRCGLGGRILSFF